MYKRTPTNWDDGNVNSGDGWSGSWNIESGYTWFGGNEITHDTWYEVWGDGIKTLNEDWDDGNVRSNDGCNALWKIESGFSWIQGQTPPLPWTHCTDIWGDGRIFGTTQWDDGNQINGDGCSSSWAIEIGYRCIDGSSTSKSICSEIWGDGLNFHTMEWDDGNINNGDGWDSNWNYEKCFQCIGGTSSNKDVCTIFKILSSVKESSNSEVIIGFSSPIEIKNITTSDLSIEINASYSVSFSWSAYFVDSYNLKVILNIPTVLTGNEVLIIKLVGWKTFRGKYGGCVSPESIQTSLEATIKIKIVSISIYINFFININTTIVFQNKKKL